MQTIDIGQPADINLRFHHNSNHVSLVVGLDLTDAEAGFDYILDGDETNLVSPADITITPNSPTAGESLLSFDVDPTDLEATNTNNAAEYILWIMLSGGADPINLLAGRFYRKEYL